MNLWLYSQGEIKIIKHKIVKDEAISYRSHREISVIMDKVIKKEIIIKVRNQEVYVGIVGTKVMLKRIAIE